MLISGGAIVPISLAEQNPPVAWSNGYHPTLGVGLSQYQFAHYGAIYKRQAWVYIVVRKRAQATSRLPFKVYRRTPTGRDLAADTPLARLLANPNPRQDAKTFWNWTASTFDIYGEAMWWKNRPSPDAPPLELWPMHPSNTVVHRNTVEDERDDSRMVAGTLAYWVQSVGGTIAKFPQADVVHFRTYNPDDLIRGLSPLEPLRLTLLNEDAARQATTSFWNRGARPGFALSTDKTLSEPAQQRLKAQFDAIAAGADKTGSTVVLEEGLSPEKLDLSAEEAQYIETRKLNREEVCGVYDMPPPVVHILDRATFSNITEQMRSLYRDTMAPLLGGYEAVVAAQLTPDFGEPDIYGEFLMDEVLRGSFEARMQAYKDGIGFGILEPAEARERENLPDGGPETHRLYMNSTMVPLGFTPAQAPTAKALDGDTLRTVMGRLSRATNVAEIDPKALTAGLNGHITTVLSVLDAAQMADDDIPAFRDRLRAATQEAPA